MPNSNLDKFESANEIVRALRRLAMDQRGRKIELLRDLDLQAGQDVVLLELAASGREVSQIELANAVEVDEPSVGRSLQRLEKKGFVERNPDPGDARKRMVQLTPEGEKLIPALKQIYIQFAEQVTGGLGSSEHDFLTDAVAFATARLKR